MFRRCLALIPLFIVGCGPMSMPVGIRLGAEEQKKYDGAWENLLRTPDRYDRAFVLDSVLFANLHQTGVDRIHFVSEKELENGTVVMISRFDREQPALDEFTLVYLDHKGSELRRERFTGKEVRDRMADFWGDNIAGGQSTPTTSGNLSQRQERAKEREQEIMDALFPERQKKKQQP